MTPSLSLVRQKEIATHTCEDSQTFLGFILIRFWPSQSLSLLSLSSLSLLSLFFPSPTNFNNLNPNPPHLHQQAAAQLHSSQQETIDSLEARLAASSLGGVATPTCAKGASSSPNTSTMSGLRGGQTKAGGGKDGVSSPTMRERPGRLAAGAADAAKRGGRRGGQVHWGTGSNAATRPSIPMKTSEDEADGGRGSGEMSEAMMTGPR